jgi:hypothetical protein
MLSGYKYVSYINEKRLSMMMLDSLFKNLVPTEGLSPAVPQHAGSEEHQVDIVEVQSEGEHQHTNEGQDVDHQSGHSEEQSQDRTFM